MKCWACNAENPGEAVFCGNPVCHQEKNEAVPLRFGKYIVQEHLGNGTFGDVYKCYDRDLDRVVAVKRLDPEKVGNSAIVREPQVICKLKHENIVDVYDAEPKKYYYVMEFVSGGTLTGGISYIATSSRRTY
jgi:serine/threonine protein kinase